MVYFLIGEVRVDEKRREGGDDYFFKSPPSRWSGRGGASTWDVRVDEKRREGGKDYFFNPPQTRGVDDGGRVDRRGE